MLSCPPPTHPACVPTRLCPARPPRPLACCLRYWLADRHGYDPFVLELDLKPFGTHQPKITLQASQRLAD